MNKQRVLVVDDDLGVAEAMSLALASIEREAAVAHSVDEGLAALARGEFDVVITDLKMPGRSGQELVEELGARDGAPPVIVLTAHGSVDAAVDAMRAGAVDFLQKPVRREVLRVALDKVARATELVRENRALRARVEALSGTGGLIAASVEMGALTDLVDRVAPTDATVLLTGESGTGKELLARRLHDRSARSSGPFVALNCAALPRDLLESELFGHEKGAFTGATHARKGRFAEANGGTLFLDEIGDLDLDLQAKLLRVLQEREVPVIGGGSVSVDVRIVCATHQNLEAQIRKGAFREDLYFRIRVVPVHIPPLRQRRADIPLLFATFVRRAAEASGRAPLELDPALVEELSARDWPGNVRELENVATRMAVVSTGPRLQKSDLVASDGSVNLGRDAHGPELGSELRIPDGGISLRGVERAMIVAALSKSKGNRSRAARLLRVPRHVLLYRLEKFSIGDDEVDALSEVGTAPIDDA